MTERLTAIAGSMFSGKTEEMVRLVRRAGHAGWQAQVFKPNIDTRWGKVKAVRSHGGAEYPATPIGKASEILENLKPETKLVAIDEVQFLGEEVIDVIEELLDRNIQVIVAGLPLDFRGEPFGPMPILLSKADDIIRLSAICTYSEDGEICGREATRTQRVINGKPASYSDPIVLIGAEESYAPRCPNHHIVPGRPKRKEEQE